MNSNRFRYALLGASAMVSAAAVASASWAADARAYDFDMPAQPLTLALKTFGATADQQLIFSEALVKDRVAPPLKGAYTPDQALAMLLSGSGLIADKTPSGVVTIRSAADPQAGSAADGADGTVQALIVTAQKREEDIQDVPIAISAFTQEDLNRSQVAGGPDLMTQVPNFTFTKTNFSGYSIQIRGIGTQAISATTDAAVAVAFNNTPFIRNRFFEQEFYDLERVEVLRGPQGTLYGRNATAGVVNILSAKPAFHYEARLSADVGNYNSTRVEGMLNLPLADDRVAVRLAGAWTKRDGFVTNQTTGKPIDGRDLWSTRLSLRVEPTDAFRANLVWEHFEESDDRLRSGKQLCKKDLRTDVAGVGINGAGGLLKPASVYTQGCAPSSLYSDDSFQTPNGFALPYYNPLILLGLPGFDNFDPYLSATQSKDLRVIESSWDPQYRAKSDLGEIQLAFDLIQNLTLSSETGYNIDVIWSAEDYNRFTTAPGAFTTEPLRVDRAGLLIDGVYCDPQVGCSDRVMGVDLSTARSRQFSQEFRLASNFDSPFNFSLGANFLRYDTEEKYYVFFNTLTLLSAINLLGAVEEYLYLPPWQLGVSDNHRCMPRGLTDGDVNKIYDVDQCKYIDPNPISDLNDLGHNYFLSKNPYKLISYAMFGEAYYNIASNLKLTAGLRWTVDKKFAPRIPSELLADRAAGYPVAEVIRQEWREPTGRLTLDWKPDLSFTDETLIYGSYSHGYKAGGANPPTSVTVVYCSGCQQIQALAPVLQAESLAHPRTFKPEFVNAFEVGSKNTLLEGKLTLNGDAFYYDYTGYQLSEIVDRAAISHNFDAKIWGLELEADWRPIENLRLGFKGGYENTRVANGMSAIDLMDRTAGDPNWVVARPFPTVPSNCILPTWVVIYPNRSGEPEVRVPGSQTIAGPCQLAYQLGLDPITELPYVPNPTVFAEQGQSVDWPNYPGWDPSTAPNHGEGIAKNLSGHALPNAPHFTATLTVDYTLPLANDWLMTLHTDLYHQSEAWTRIFNDPGYDKLKAYNNVNVAAIFSNEEAGWKVMAYVKNVLDKDNITGAFLNSDDTGLTTNVFLNEPRLYGLRVTKNWSGGSIWQDADRDPDQPYPFDIELSGQALRKDAPYSPVRPAFFDQFSPGLDPAQAQNRTPDRGEGGGVRLAYTPAASKWWISTGMRWSKTSTLDKVRKKELGPGSCIVGPEFGELAERYCVPGGLIAGIPVMVYPTDYTNEALASIEKHKFADFMIGSDVGIGLAGLTSSSRIGIGLGYADLESSMHMSVQGVPNWNVPVSWAFNYSQHDRFDAAMEAERTFKGAGPVISWEASKDLLKFKDGGAVDLSWAANGGVLFGKQNARLSGKVTDEYFNIKYQYVLSGYASPTATTVTPIDIRRRKSATVPMLDLSVGLTYEIERVKVGAGYRWERYFNAIDGGYAEHKSYDRTIDGPYFKVSVGFGG